MIKSSINVDTRFLILVRKRVSRLEQTLTDVLEFAQGSMNCGMHYGDAGNQSSFVDIKLCCVGRSNHPGFRCDAEPEVASWYFPEKVSQVSARHQRCGGLHFVRANRVN